MTAEEALARANARAGLAPHPPQEGDDHQRQDRRDEVDADAVFSRLKSLKNDQAN
jgi:hypothetical protein